MTRRSEPSSRGLSMRIGIPVRAAGPTRTKRASRWRSQRRSYSGSRRGTTVERIRPVDRAPLEVAELQRSGERQRQLVGGRVAAGGEPPIADQLGAREGTDVGLGVADIDREQHRPIVATAAGAMRVGSRR